MKTLSKRIIFLLLFSLGASSNGLAGDSSRAEINRRIDDCALESDSSCIFDILKGMFEANRQHPLISVDSYNVSWTRVKRSNRISSAREMCNNLFRGNFDDWVVPSLRLFDRSSKKEMIASFGKLFAEPSYIVTPTEHGRKLVRQLNPNHPDAWLEDAPVVWCVR